MKLKTYLSLALGLGLILSFSACEDDALQDLESPSILVTEPAMNEAFAAGTGVHFEATFEDDNNLASFEIDIHDAFDGHEHKRTAALEKWTFKQSFDMGGKLYEAHFHDEVMISENALAGPYHFIVKALDASGNATSYQDGSTVELQIIVTNESQAQVSLDMPAGETELEGEPGQPMSLSGMITDSGDEAGIEEITFILGEEHDHDHDHEHKSAMDEDDEVSVDFDFEDAPTSVDISALDLSTLVVPADAVADEHKMLTIRVKDIQGNITLHMTEVHIHVD